ncbi:MAG TPA: ABC transporter ATP-binding protein [Stellaceae bacterium]|nr:ABC transporter ATP-binding protein [Stellaceae bacterium]
MAAGSGLALHGIEKNFGATRILSGVTLEAAQGEFIALVGPSGCGKTTLLRIAAGLDYPDQGRVELGGRDITARRAADRDIAMVFQSYALYPHLTVRQNMALPLAMRRLSLAQRLPVIGRWLPGTRETTVGIAESVAQAAATLRIDQLLDRKPGQLSGGQRQRVALGRALVRHPRAFLMDEPLSNLDATLRVHTRTEIVELHRQAGVTTLYVTHDQAEALSMADRVAVMMGGVLLQVAPPAEIYRDPRHRLVAEFIGSPRINLIDAVVDDVGSAVAASGEHPVALVQGLALPPGTPVSIGIRPEHVRLRAPAADRLPVTLSRLEFLGSEVLAHLVLDAGRLPIIAKLVPDEVAGLTAGRCFGLETAPADRLVFAADGQRIDVEPVAGRVALHA